MKSQFREKQIQELDGWIKSCLDSRELKRALTVKLALQGCAYTPITESLKVSENFIRKGHKRYKSNEISDFKLSYQRAVSYLTAQQNQEVIECVKSQKYWELSKIDCYLVEQDNVVSKSPISYYELLKTVLKSWQKAQKKHPPQNAEVVKKWLQEIKLKLENLMPDTRGGQFAMYAIYEVHLLEGDLISHFGGDSQDRLHIPLLNEKNGQTYYRALNLLHTGLILGKYDKVNGDYIVKFWKKLIRKNTKNQIIIFWYSASYPKGEKLRNFLKKVNGELAEKSWRITGDIFPHYSPYKKPIEAVWLSLKTLLIRCYRFGKNFSIIKRRFEMLVVYKLFNFT